MRAGCGGLGAGEGPQPSLPKAVRCSLYGTTWEVLENKGQRFSLGSKDGRSDIAGNSRVDRDWGAVSTRLYGITWEVQENKRWRAGAGAELRVSVDRESATGPSSKHRFSKKAIRSWNVYENNRNAGEMSDKISELMSENARNFRFLAEKMSELLVFEDRNASRNESFKNG